MLLLSPPGCGKSQFCRALGEEAGRLVLVLDAGSLLGSLVGQSEERTRQVLRIINAMAPCVAMIDEVEKAFAGVNGSGDSGLSSRMFGTFPMSLANRRQMDSDGLRTERPGDAFQPVRASFTEVMHRLKSPVM